MHISFLKKLSASFLTILLLLTAILPASAMEFPFPLPLPYQPPATIDLSDVDAMITKDNFFKKLQNELLVTIEENQDESEILGQSIVDEAKSWIGITPYVGGGRSLYAGTDCSGFVNLIYAKFGINLPTASSVYQSSVGHRISYSELKPGDIVVYQYGGHVAIYAGDDTIVHCATNYHGVSWESMFFFTPTAYVRVLDD